MGYYYLVVFVDEYTRFLFAYLLRSRDELNAIVRQFLADFRAAARSISRGEAMPPTVRAILDVEQLRSDNAGEFMRERRATRVLACIYKGPKWHRREIHRIAFRDRPLYACL